MDERRLDPVTLDTFAGGAAAEKFAKAFNDVLVNVLDPNTPATAKRTITMTFVVVPDEARRKMDGTVACVTKLAPHRAADAIMYIGVRDETPVAVVFDPTQRDLFQKSDRVVPLRVAAEGSAEG